MYQYENSHYSFHSFSHSSLHFLTLSLSIFFCSSAIVGKTLFSQVNFQGELIMVDALKSGLAWGPFLWIRVRIDITKPLMQ